MKKLGRGMASMWYPIGFTVTANPSAVTLKVNEDGSITLMTGTVETGQGSLTVLAQIAAEEMGVTQDRVYVVSGDTDVTPVDTGPIASRTTYTTGNAIRVAAHRAKGILYDAAAELLNIKPEQMEARDGRIQAVGYPPCGLDMGTVARHAQVVRGEVPMGTGSWNPPTVSVNGETGQGKPFATYVYATQMAEVEVDDETGEITVIRVAAAHDCGTPINPMLAEGQVEGGISMGIGLALTEQMMFKEGAQLNPGFRDYMLPTTMDMPKIDVTFIDSFDPTGPFGAKGLGEPTLVPTAPAILNAIYDAVGVRIRSLPATPEKVLAALHLKEQKED